MSNSNNGQSHGLITQDGGIGGAMPLDPTTVRPIDNRSERRDLHRYFTRILRDVTEFDRVAERRRHHQWFVAEEYYNSRQDGFFQGNRYQTPDDQDGIIYQCNYYSEKIWNALSNWMAAKIEYIVYSDESSNKGIAAARGATQIVQHYDRRFNTPLEEQLTGLNACLHGNYGFRTYYDPLVKPYGQSSVKVPYYKMGQMANTARTFVCPGCQSYGDISQAQTHIGEDESTDWFGCPECGTPVQLLGSEQFDTYEMQEVEYQLGDIVSMRLSPFLFGIDPCTRGLNIKTAGWFYQQQRLPVPFLKKLYPHLAHAIHSDMPGQRFQYEYALQRQLGVMANDTMSYGHARYWENHATVTEVWMDPSEYYGLTTEDISDFMDGSQVPADTPLEDIYPDGFCLVGISGMPADVRTENKCDVLSLGVYWPSPTAAYGQGIWSPVYQQKLLNAATNFAVDSVATQCNPKYIVNQRVLDNNNISGNLTNLITVDVPLDTELEKLMVIKQAQGINSSVTDFIDRCKIDMIAGSRTSQAGMGQAQPGGSPELDKQNREQAYMQGSLCLRLKGETYANRCEQYVKWSQRTFITKRQFPIPMESDYSRIEVIELSNIDIDTELHVGYAPHSAIPLTVTDRREDFLQALEVGYDDENIPLKRRKRIGEVFQQPIVNDELNKHQRMAEMKFKEIQNEIKRFNAFKAQYPMEAEMMMQPDPAEMDQFWMGMPAIIKEILTRPLTASDYEWEDHQVYLNFIQDWALTDSGYLADEFTKATMKAWFAWHRDARVRVQEANSADQAQATAPQLTAAQLAGSSLGGAALPSQQFVNPEPVLAQGNK